MDQNMTEQMKKTYPTVFEDNFYFECGPGWANLISEIARFISSRTNKCKASQVKEKFGTLRFYIDCGDGIDEEKYNEIAQFISAIERRSARICEECGVELDENNRVKGRKYWIRSMCEDCSKKIYKNESF